MSRLVCNSCGKDFLSPVGFDNQLGSHRNCQSPADHVDVCLDRPAMYFVIKSAGLRPVWGGTWKFTRESHIQDARTAFHAPHIYIRRYAGANLVCDDICSVVVIQLKFEEMARMYGFSCEVWIEFYSELSYSKQTGLHETTPVHHDRVKYRVRWVMMEYHQFGVQKKKGGRSCGEPWMIISRKWSVEAQIRHQARSQGAAFSIRTLLA